MWRCGLCGGVQRDSGTPWPGSPSIVGVPDNVLDPVSLFTPNRPGPGVADRPGEVALFLVCRLGSTGTTNSTPSDRHRTGGTPHPGTSPSFRGVVRRLRSTGAPYPTVPKSRWVGIGTSTGPYLLYTTLCHRRSSLPLFRVRSSHNSFRPPMGFFGYLVSLR